MKTFPILLLILPLVTFAAENYQQFAQEKANQQQQNAASCAQVQEAAELIDSAKQRASEVESYVSWMNSGVEKKQTKTQQEKKIIVFVSFSMPEISLRQWLSDAHKFGASVVIRGLKNNSFKDTAIEMEKLLGKDQVGGVELNPLVFQEFKITQVPAVVMVDESSHKHYTVYGNVSLEYALKVIADKKAYK